MDTVGHHPHLHDYDYSAVTVSVTVSVTAPIVDGGSCGGPTLVLSHLCYADLIIYFVCPSSQPDGVSTDLHVTKQIKSVTVSLSPLTLSLPVCPVCLYKTTRRSELNIELVRAVVGAGQVTGSCDQGESDSQLYQPVCTVCTSSVLTGTGDHSTYKLMDEDQEKLTRDI